MSTKTNTKTTRNDDTKNDAKTTPKTFKLASLSRELGHNPKMVRARFRRYVVNDDEKYNVVRETCKNAKSRWVYPIALRNAISEIIKRDDDE